MFPLQTSGRRRVKRQPNAKDGSDCKNTYKFKSSKAPNDVQHFPTCKLLSEERKDDEIRITTDRRISRNHKQ